MNTYHDGNGIHTLLVVGTDGVSLMNVQVNPSTHVLSVSNGTTGSDNGPRLSIRDNNHVPILMGVSSADGKTPVAIYGSNGAILTQST